MPEQLNINRKITEKILITNILAAAAYDMRVKNLGKTNYSSSGGGNLDWNANDCHALHSPDWGMELIDYDAKCKGMGVLSVRVECE
ncbi:hypothetical protein CORC01_03637 [Colletotrichum orchidophilum]|uniref:Uncharacterized protein n=1 Tax=Colletotrichum orchidophilum TaxID=1209926 RepID=A0A1G4BHT9_9PEZI|nr:uncharacterized protein CORC01_03637 [Colletotrichum orchidophilum]OHF01070.1 hypothetical protein CORC01_03637 [Colletotrichum orchidophilum]